MGIIVIVAYKAKPGKIEKLKAITKLHVPRLKKEGLVTEREPIIMQATDDTIVEVFEWLSDEAIQKAHNNNAVRQMWEEYAEVCEYVPISQLSEAGDLFASFKPME